MFNLLWRQVVPYRFRLSNSLESEGRELREFHSSGAAFPDVGFKEGEKALRRHVENWAVRHSRIKVELDWRKRNPGLIMQLFFPRFFGKK